MEFNSATDTFSFERNTDVLGGYRNLQSADAQKEQEKIMGRYSRENQLASAAACTSFKASHYVKEALRCQNTKLLNPLSLIKDNETGEIRLKELSSLMIACIMGNMQCVQQLIKEARKRLTKQQFDQYVNIKVSRDMGGNNALLYACNSSNSNYMLVHYLINEAGADPDAMNDYAINCLLIATKKSQLNILDLLLENGVDIGFVDRNGCNALHIASAAGYQDIVEMILLYWSKMKSKAAKNKEKQKDGGGFEIDCTDNTQTTSLMKAAVNGHQKIIQLLLRFGADPRVFNARGETALTLACMQENYTICHRLIVANADVNQIDEQGRTPLLKAARHNSKSDIIKLLLEFGANTDTADKELNTPLHFAAIRGTKDVATYLIKLGANPYAKNAAGNVPYEEVTKDEVLPYFQVCLVCKKHAPMACNHCNVVRYCNIECQKKDWQNHRKFQCHQLKKKGNSA